MPDDDPTEPEPPVRRWEHALPEQDAAALRANCARFEPVLRRLHAVAPGERAGRSLPLTIAEAARRIARRELSPVALVEDLLARIDRLDPTLGSFVLVLRDAARAAAHEAEREIQAGRSRGPLHGIPIGLKDNIETAGALTRANSRLLADHVPATDATAVRRLRQAGAIILGKHNLNEFAFGPLVRELPASPPRNPWHLDRVPGGSSSGSAAAIAAGLCPGALGTDSGGSIRWPSALCGIAGLKPTFGRVGRRGLVRYIPTLDHCGPMAWTSEDCALLLQAIAGPDPDDPASVDRPTQDWHATLAHGVAGLRIGIVRHFYRADMQAEPEIAGALEAAWDVLGGLGAELGEAQLPSLLEFDACGRTLLVAENLAQHERDLAAHPEAYSAAARAWYPVGAMISADDHDAAQALRQRLNHEMARVMRDWDVLVTAAHFAPAGPYPEPGAEAALLVEPSPRMPFNVTGQPALVVCCGFTTAGLPIGMQIVGRRFDEAAVLRIGHAYEQATPWRDRRPPIAS